MNHKITKAFLLNLLSFSDQGIKKERPANTDHNKTFVVAQL